MDPIKHVVVLMLENRSFDQMLGFMGVKNKDIDGVKQSRYNIDPRDGSKVYQEPITVVVNKNDPMHEFNDCMEQMNNYNGGFVENYVNKYSTATKAQTKEVMGYYDDGSLPALHQLAKNYVVCDKWFSSVPGPTWPNRFFVHSGTSLGHVDMPSTLFDPGWHTYDQTTIYDLLEEKDISWRIYFDGVPHSIVMTHQLAYASHYHIFTEFVDDCKGKESKFPSYVFIEPDYSGADQNDQHPPSNILNGDALIATVYNAIRSNNELWNSTLFIILYDENGGFYDHVIPPETVAPDWHKDVFKFDKLGFRVPAILISPHLAKGVDHTEYDHTSVLKYLCDKWSLNAQLLGGRTPLANSFGHLIEDAVRARSPKAAPVVEKTTNPTRPLVENSNEDALISFNQYMVDQTSINAEDRCDINCAYDKAYAQTLDMLKKT